MKTMYKDIKTTGEMLGGFLGNDNGELTYVMVGDLIFRRMNKKNYFARMWSRFFLRFIVGYAVKYLNPESVNRPVDSFEDMVSNKRRDGNTTRLMDYYIQKLFHAGEILVEDHYNTYNSNKRLFVLIVERLSREHARDNRTFNENFTADESTLKIKLKK